MPRFSANLSLMFTEHAFLDRFDAARAAGFDAVEFQFPYELEPAAIAEQLQRNRLTLALFNLPPGDWAAGEKGFAARPDKFDELQSSLHTALPYALATGVKRLHLLAGNADRRDGAAALAFRRSLAVAAHFFAPHGIDVLIEPLNRRDAPGYFLDDVDFAHDLVRELAIANLKLQFDVYHGQILHGDVTTRLREMLPVIGHVQVASVPSRHEPDGEELNYPFLFAELDRLGYAGFVGAEYRPRAATVDGLGWFRPYARP
ncbi:TIM barrel protein [Rhodopseudomonas palustris]|uniref:Hydroxypyruvate isomerase n=1 Tax=Rhodopseudomonas palustris (strain DX-1) TaxID=652103 RepID=E6VGU4_RHOPX|nr:2-oxo-tetronate isomerase [Rhodopseudomonas palustris]QDL96635.1 TIM barrel protein [Rhodopseudomonas palustris]